MAAVYSKSPYSRVNAHEETPETSVSDGVELQVLRDESNSQDKKTHTEVPQSQSRRPPFPWQGVTALVSIVLLTAAAVGVLLASNGSPIERWKIRNVNTQPQVWLSVLATITDGLTMFALAKAAEATYWRAAARGTTLRNMYDLYEFHSLVGAINNLVRLRGNRLAVVTLLCLVSALRGPLFQRASVVVGNATWKTSGVQKLNVAQLIPPIFFLDTPILINGSLSNEECGDVCSGKVKGYGFDIKCSEVTKIPWDISGNSTVRQEFQDMTNRIGDAVPAFNSSAHLQGLPYPEYANATDFIAAEQRGWFEVVNLFKTEPICGGDLSISTCSLHHAVVEYEVSLRNGTISLSRDNWQEDNVLFQTPTWLLPDLINQDTTWGPTVQWAAWYLSQFNQEISINPNRDGGPFEGVDPRFLLAKRFINGTISAPNCNTTFGDPTQFVLNRLREMAFRVAVAVAGIADRDALFGSRALAQEGLPLTQNWTQGIDVTGQRSVVALSVSIPYLVCAVVCSLLAVVAIVPLYWAARSEELRPLSFNPLDVARIFDAPLLRDADEKDIEGYVRKEDGARRVRYGVRGSADSEGMVAARIISEDK
ncbi:uncharacterized protein K460DRAFT_372824 [Cucurbitaria berberidis CBS 394.84]|uniref:Uncharacterized protein n=1 Tax=Cucurbitaria berberidis CBS 394.84 TaxID=1168544 RepID=A0A9P4LD29_9PLEO|nr:uncharacterized protein K460DRAFT_372824 [Cucurbitaria berberidis CBS 394.84]KAF1850625.1 hypothetical protein K460DRAFT_372824 [Cucurbitaria berberidis CBS 394.84]